jgi:hypothetical protein
VLCWAHQDAKPVERGRAWYVAINPPVVPELPESGEGRLFPTIRLAHPFRSLGDSHFIPGGETVPAGCSGNAQAPKAAPGHLWCLSTSAAS